MRNRPSGEMMNHTQKTGRRLHRVALVAVLLALALLPALTPHRAQAQAEADIPMADDVTTRVVTGPETLTVGDIGTLTVEVTHPAGLQVFIPQTDDIWGDFEVVDRAPLTTVDNGDGTETTSQTLDVRLFAPGQFVTPALVVKISDPGGNVAQTVVQPVTVNVASVLTGEENGLRDIKPQAALPATGLLTLIALSVVLGVVLFALVGWLIYRLLQRRPAKDTRTPAQIALDDLEQVGAADLVAAGQMKEHAGLVTDALRRYLTTQYGVAAMDRTTAELRSMLRGINMSEKNALCCDDIFSNADLIKFADVHASPSAATRLLDEARTVVVETDAELAALRAAQKLPGNTNPPASNAAAAGA